MAKIKVKLNGAYSDGRIVTFKAPCNCDRPDGLTISYMTENNGVYTENNVDFTFKDSLGNDVLGLGNLFAKDAYVSVILDTTNKYAYLQNANTNSYIENVLRPVGVVANVKHVYPKSETELMKQTLEYGLYVFRAVVEFNDRSINSVGTRKIIIKVGDKIISSVEAEAADMGSTGVQTTIEDIVLGFALEGDEVSVHAVHTSDDYSDIHCVLTRTRVGAY